MSESAEMSNEHKADSSTTDNGRQDTVKDVEMGTSGAETVKDPERRRSKSGRRRSGFSRGRVSLTQLSKETSATDTDMAGSELYKQIPMELSAAQRLGLLSRLQLRCTLEVLGQQFDEVPGFENFKAEALESVGAMVDQMERDGTFQEACTTSSLASNPVNHQMDITISALSSCIKRLEKEEADWGELVNRLETQARSAEEQLNQLEVEYGDLPEDVKQLSLSFLPSSPDLAATCADTVKDVKTVSMLMGDYSHSVELLNVVHKAAVRHMDRVTTTLGEASEFHRCDPKKSIQHLLAS